MKHTKIGNSYWDGNGIYQEEYDNLYETLVPSHGSSKTLNGELIRSISRLFYEYCNNGNINSRDEKYVDEEEPCWDCGGSGIITDYDNDEEIEIDCEYCGGCGYNSEEVLDETYISPMYKQFLQLIEQNVPDIKNDIKNVSNIILNNYKGDEFSDENIQYYNDMCDKVIYYVINNEDRDLPKWYITN